MGGLFSFSEYPIGCYAYDCDYNNGDDDGDFCGY